MSNAVGSSKKLLPLLKKLRGKGHEARSEGSPPDASLGDAGVTELVFALLLCDSTTQAARSAMKRLCEAVVDANELRVLMPDEIVAVLGERYPGADERARRILAALSDIHRRQYSVSLAHLAGASTREARGYLDSLEGVPPFAAARVALLCLALPAIPVDARLAHLLVDADVVSEDAAPGEIGTWIEKQIAASEAPSVHSALQAWSDEHGQAAKPRERATEPPARKRVASARPAKAAPKSPARSARSKAAGTSRTTKPKG